MFRNFQTSKMKRYLAIGLVISAILVSSSNAAFAGRTNRHERATNNNAKNNSANVAQIQESKALPIIGIIQEESNWCWSATGVSVTKFMKPQFNLISQSDFVKKVKGQVENTSAFPKELQKGLIAYGLESIEGGAQSFRVVKDNINQNQPLIPEIKWSEGGWHYVVMYGYYQNATMQTVSYMDPWGPNQRFTTKAYKEFVSNGSFTWDWGIFNIH